MSAEAGNALGEAQGVYTGNLKAEAPNAIVAEVNAIVAAEQPRSIVRWWEAVPADLQGDLVAAMGAFMLDPTPEQATEVDERPCRRSTPTTGPASKPCFLRRSRFGRGRHPGQPSSHTTGLLVLPEPQ
jgi:hypothetical protein